jgi:hypothetical protein
MTEPNEHTPESQPQVAVPPEPQSDPRLSVDVTHLDKSLDPRSVVQPQLTRNNEH